MTRVSDIVKGSKSSGKRYSMGTYRFGKNGSINRQNAASKKRASVRGHQSYRVGTKINLRKGK